MIASSLWLSLLMLGIGVVIGALAAAARLGLPQPGAPRVIPSWWGWINVGMGALTSLIGGWLGVLVFGRLYGLPTALWVSVLGATLLPWAIQRLRWPTLPPSPTPDS